MQVYSLTAVPYKKVAYNKAMQVLPMSQMNILRMPPLCITDFNYIE